MSLSFTDLWHIANYRRHPHGVACEQGGVVGVADLAKVRSGAPAEHLAHGRAADGAVRHRPFIDGLEQRRCGWERQAASLAHVGGDRRDDILWEWEDSVLWLWQMDR